jgi:hypothetical protein
MGSTGLTGPSGPAGPTGASGVSGWQFVVVPFGLAGSPNHTPHIDEADCPPGRKSSAAG